MGIGSEIIHRQNDLRMQNVTAMIESFDDAELAVLQEATVNAQPSLTDDGRKLLMSRNPRTNGVVGRMIYEYLNKPSPAKPPVSAPRMTAAQFLADDSEPM